VTSEEGRSTIFEAGDTFRVLAENDLEEPVLATPALLGGRLYFRSAAHLLCVGKSDDKANNAHFERGTKQQARIQAR
jgi:hypothetical protein